MPTANQCGLYRTLAARFGRTEEFRTVDAERDFSRLNATQAYVHLADLMRAVQGLRYIKLPRYAGLPRTAEERRASLRRALREERHARLECPEDERDEWCADTRPSAMGIGRAYLEAQDELRESLEIDRGFFRPLPALPVERLLPR